MPHRIAAPLGLGLPYSALFAVPARPSASTQSQSQFFWNCAINPSSANKNNASNSDTEEDADSEWLHPDAPAISPSILRQANAFGSTNDSQPPILPRPKKSALRSLTSLRHIAFRAFIPSSRSSSAKQNSTVHSTEFVSRRSVRPKQPGSHSFTIFSSWRAKSKRKTTKVRQLVAVLDHRVSSKSPPEHQPATWQEYNEMYAQEKIDIMDPPLPPTEPAPAGQAPTPYEAKFYSAPRPSNEPLRQLVVDRLGLFGPKPFDDSESAGERAKARAELADQLNASGTAPESLEAPWDPCSLVSTPESPHGLLVPYPETLEQHPVLLKLVKQCRDMFGTSMGILSVMDQEKQIFLAQSGAPPSMRHAPRDITFCAHTVLSGRKGFAVLDTHKDWRFTTGAMTQDFGCRFYAGVPLMAPSLDESPHSEQGACPLGTLCVIDVEPRKAFGVEDRKRLVYMSEFARRELESWFLKKMEHKKTILSESHRLWTEQVTSIATQPGSTEDEGEAPTEGFSGSSEPQPQASGPSASAAASPARAWRLSSHRKPKQAPPNALSTPLTSPSPHDHTSLQPTGSAPTGPSLFDDTRTVIGPKAQKVFDLATRLAAETLDLSLVYLLGVSPPGESEDEARTAFISGFNVPLPTPIFDPGLHLRALQTPEGGLLYQNPTAEQAHQEALHPKPAPPATLPDKEPAREPDGAEGEDQAAYASAMLVSVRDQSLAAEERGPSGGGYVLAGFTSDPKRVFGGEDVAYMKQFAHELAKYTVKLRM